MVLRRCRISVVKFRIWFLLVSGIAWLNKFFAKGLKHGNQIDVLVSSAKYKFLIKALLIIDYVFDEFYGSWLVLAICYLSCQRKINNEIITYLFSFRENSC